MLWAAPSHLHLLPLPHSPGVEVLEAVLVFTLLFLPAILLPGHSRGELLSPFSTNASDEHCQHSETAPRRP